jgi:hypothetical protein
MADFGVMDDAEILRDGSPPITIESIRNTTAHGDPFDTMPWDALVEVLRDLIHYADRDRLNQI